MSFYFLSEDINTSMMPRSTEQVLKSTTLKKNKNHKNKRFLPSKAAASKNSKFYDSLSYVSSKAFYSTVFKYIEP